LSAANLSAGAAAVADVAFVLERAGPLTIVAVVLVLGSSVPARRYARGPPSVSFGF
jgi:hypothetical protein